MSFLSLTTLSSLCNLFLITLLLTSKSKAGTNDQQFQYFCDKNNDRGNFVTGDTYDNNLKFAFLHLTFDKKLDYGFTNTIFGENNNKVNLIGICRGDINPQDCRKCIIGSKGNLTQACPNKKEAIGWYQDEKCMLRYSDRSILNLNEIGPAYFAWNMNNATLADQFNVVVKQLLNDLKSNAIKGDSNRKYGVGTLPGPSSGDKIYGLVQCTPDLTGPQCDDCLTSSIVEVSRCCSNRIGARIVRPSCNLRFETSYQFYQPSAARRFYQPSDPASNLP